MRLLIKSDRAATGLNVDLNLHVPVFENLSFFFILHCTKNLPQEIGLTMLEYRLILVMKVSVVVNS